MPFLPDEDYEKVLGECDLRDLRGTSTCLSLPCLHGAPLGQPSAAAPPLEPLSVPGYVEADKENGESVWVAPEAPAPQAPGDTPAPRAPGDAPALQPPLCQSEARPGTHAAPPVSSLVPRVTRTRKLPRPCPPACGAGGRAGHAPSPVGSNLGLEAVVPRVREKKGRGEASWRRRCLLKVSKDFSRSRWAVGGRRAPFQQDQPTNGNRVAIENGVVVVWLMKQEATGKVWGLSSMVLLGLGRRCGPLVHRGHVCAHIHTLHTHKHELRPPA